MMIYCDRMGKKKMDSRFRGNDNINYGIDKKNKDIKINNIT